MPYSKEHKEKSRNRILASAAKLFPRHGFEAVSIDLLMEDAGLTRGAFYAHFATKADVYAESMFYTAQHSPFRKFEEIADDKAWFDKTVAHYLSREHIEQDASPCPLAFFVTDINRSDEQVRNTYTQLYLGMVKLFQQRRADSAADGDAILAATAMMIGGAALAKALNDKRASDKLLRACRSRMRQLLAIG